MKIRIKASRRRPDKITLQMASMIDAVFLLLSYFLVTTAMSKPEDRLGALLQTQSKEAAASDFQPQKVDVLMVDGAPTYRLGGKALRDREELRRALDNLPEDAGVFIIVHDDVLVSFAVAAVQVARDCGFEKVTYVPAK